MMDGMGMLMGAGPAIAAVLLLAAVKGVLVLGATAGVARLLEGRSSAAVRHVVWTVGLLAMVALPVLGVVLPRWHALPDLIPTVGFDVETVPVLTVEEVPPVAPVVAGSPVELEYAREGSGSVAAAPTPRLPAPTGVESAAAVEPLPLDVLASGGTWAVDARVTGVSWAAGLGWALVALWGAGAGVLGGLTLFGLARVLRIEQRSRPLAGVRWERLLDEACEEAGVMRPVRLLESADVPVPMTWGWRRPVVVLPAAAASWNDARLRQALLHELAHVARADQPLHLLGRLAAALHWPNPLAWYALGRMRLESEQAADDLVLRVGTRPSDYAAGLVAVARELPSVHRLPAAALAMARTSQLGGRVEAILDPARQRRGASRFDVLAVVIVLMGFALPVSALAMRQSAPVEPMVFAVSELPPLPPIPPVPPVPAVSAVAPVPPAGSGFAWDVRAELGRTQVDLRDLQDRLVGLALPHTQEADVCLDPDHRIRSDMINVNDDGLKANWSTRECQWILDVRGEVTFTDAEDDIAALTPGGRFELEQSGLGVTHEIRIDADRSGRLSRVYRLDGEERPATEAAGWLQQVVPEILRVTGLDVEARVERLLERGGVEAVLAEVGRIRSGYTARRYLTALLQSDAADARAARAALQIAAERIDSDYEMAELLRAIPEDVRTPQVRAAYLAAAGTIDSDYELRRTLEAFLVDGAAPDETALLIELASHIDSDYEVVELLLALVRDTPLDEATLTAFLDVIQSVDSDYEARRALTAALQQEDISYANLDRLLDRIDTIDSDFERAEVLLDLVRRVDSLDDRLEQRVVDSAERIDSEYERNRVLAAVVRAR
ncbi:MAG: M56 family metallopeptidase [Gemmatimonadota bacterium]